MSFSAALPKLPGTNSLELTATTYDSESTLLKKYDPFAASHIKILKQRKAKVFHDVDASNLKETLCKALGISLDDELLYDIIVWNFPHAGFPETGSGPGFEWEGEGKSI